MLTTIVIHRKGRAKWSEVAGSSTADITITRCEAYELTKLGQEYEVIPEPEYDVIPAFEGGQQESMRILLPNFMSVTEFVL